ncbi:MAG: twin-arginine translocase subunit TatC, partial [Rhodospirillaceae bacterium]|nr:twin-arginine translocase subunit TatC [Rhodospirillaceae bacterium]
IISQVALALPIMVLYEISIIAVRMIEKKAALREAEEDDDETAP